MKTTLFAFAFLLSAIAHAGSPLWTFTPLTATTLSLLPTDMATVQYLVTNQSKKTHTLALRPIAGVTQNTGGLGICASPFVLLGNQSCTLSLAIDGARLANSFHEGPVVCESGSALQCYQPARAAALNITKRPAPTGLAQATLVAVATPSTIAELATSTLSTTGGSGTGMVTFSIVTGSSNCSIAGTTLTGSSSGTCTVRATKAADGTYAAATSATITVTVTALPPPPTLSSVTPTSGPTSGGTPFTLTGTNLTGTTAVVVGGVSATNVNVVNSTTVTAVTTVHAVGLVDISLSTSGGNADLLNSFTYVATAVGQQTSGGVIACLNGGSNNLIAQVSDASTGVEYGPDDLATGATSTTDGASNTDAIAAATVVGPPNAAKLCSAYEVDSQGNTPCEVGNACYDDWFLPAGNNATASGQLHCLYMNRVAVGGFVSDLYWSSTENNTSTAFTIDFGTGGSSSDSKLTGNRARCVREFAP